MDRHQRGPGGAKADHGARRVSRVLDQHNPDVLTIMYGAINISQKNTGTYISDMRLMIQEAKRREVTVVIGNLLPMSGERAHLQGDVIRLNQDLARLASQENVMLVDLFNEFTGPAATERFPDGRHPDEDGTQMVAIVMREAIKRATR